MRAGVACFLGAVLAAPVYAEDASGLAQAAVEQFRAAHEQLEVARAAPDRVRALTGVVSAYEGGLEAMRAGMRQVALREAELSAEFADESGRVSTLLSALINLKPDASPEALAHPNGPLGQARAGMLVSAVTPALQAEAEALRLELEEVTILRELQAEAVEVLSLGLTEAQQARTELSQAMSERRDLPRRFTNDDTRLQTLIDGSETLEAFASGLAVMDVVDGIDPLPVLEDSNWEMPVSGTLLRGYEEPDAAGVVRPGWLWATRPLSVITTPYPATVRYQGPFPDYGNVIILEPGNDILLVLAGMDEVYGEVGAVLPQGAAIGLMGGTAPDLDAFVENAVQGTGVSLSETLYIEIREGGKPVNPERWFANAPL